MMLVSETRGGTLPDLLVGLILTALLVSMAAPRIRAGGDRWSVLGAREELVALLGEARALALVRGQAWLAVEPDSGAVILGARDDTVRVAHLGTRWQVELTHGTGDRRPLVVRFDDLGLGRGAARSFHLRRGETAAALSLSLYGRVRRW